ncbi:MAG: hypothetical protein ABI134_08645 [Byssovorax sp.]
MRNHASLRAPAAALLVAAAALTAASCSLVLGIGEPSLDPAGGSGGAGGSGTVTSSATPVSSATSSGTGGSGGSEVTYPCTPTDPVCKQVKSDCLAVYDNKDKTSFALRIGQLDFYSPSAFNGNVEKAAFATSITMNLPKCNLKGSGTFSWLFHLDTAAHTFRIGTSKPVSDPHNGYSFVDEIITQNGQMYPIAPLGGTATVAADGAIVADTIESIILPAYLTSQATDALLIPLHKVHIVEAKTKISSDQNCIGRYNVANLKPSQGCLPSPDDNIDAFIIGGRFTGFISLEEADKVIITSFGLNRSLCVLLSGSSGLFGDGASPAKCKRVGTEIKFNGDWCSSTNQGAAGLCYDAVSLDVGFAASAVELK